MASSSDIEWTDASYTPIRARNLKTGKIGWHCEHATTGCEFCYAEGMNKRLGTGLPFKPGHRKDIEIFLDEKMLLAPLRWKKSRMIFVCSMTDLFADFVTDEWLDKIFAVMALCPQHTFQLLTKRAERMREYLSNPDHAVRWFRIIDDEWAMAMRDMSFERVTPNAILSNVWLGVSCERQEEADERIPLLLQTPAAVRFISAEPLLGAIDLTKLTQQITTAEAPFIDAVRGEYWRDLPRTISKAEARLDWVIVGGESGPKARPFNLAWAREIARQCKTAGVACFIKQLGSKPFYQTHDANCTSQDTGRNIQLIPKDRKGGDWSEWPEDLRVREFPVIDSSVTQRGLSSPDSENREATRS